MAGGVIPETIQKEHPWFTQQTLERWNKVGVKYVPQIGHWIQKAHNALRKESNFKNSQKVRQQTFMNENEVTKNGKTKIIISEKRGVGFKGAEGGWSSSDSLLQQWNSVVQASERYQERSDVTEISQELTNRNLLTEGYFLLTRVGEAIRGDGEVDYKVVASAKTAVGTWSKAVEWNLNLFQFLNVAAHFDNGKQLYFDTGISSEKRIREKALLNGVESKEWTKQDLWDFNMFLRQAERFISLQGKRRIFPLAGIAKTINAGQALEAYLQLHLHYQFRRSGDKGSWLELRKEFYMLLKAKTKQAVDETLEDPAPFWQGGEGGLLSHTQVKGSGASITNMLTLVRQMTRIYAILVQLPGEVGKEIKQDVFKNSLKLNDDEAINAIIEMFYRDGWKEAYAIEIKL